MTCRHYTRRDDDTGVCHYAPLPRWVTRRDVVIPNDFCRDCPCRQPRPIYEDNGA